MKQLKRATLIFQIRNKNLRVILFSKFPFMIIFQVEESDIVLSKLVHARRNPANRFKT